MQGQLRRSPDAGTRTGLDAMRCRLSARLSASPRTGTGCDAQRDVAAGDDAVAPAPAGRDGTGAATAAGVVAGCGELPASAPAHQTGVVVVAQTIPACVRVDSA